MSKNGFSKEERKNKEIFQKEEIPPRKIRGAYKILLKK
jgi:hypothetical protein